MPLIFVISGGIVAQTELYCPGIENWLEFNDWTHKPNTTHPTTFQSSWLPLWMSRPPAPIRIATKS
jgi:hypothetical protein